VAPYRGPFDEDAFIEVQGGLRAIGSGRIVRDHQDRFVILAAERGEQVEDFVGAFAVKVAGGLVAK
jgi:hypothetical protein